MFSWLISSRSSTNLLLLLLMIASEFSRQIVNIFLCTLTVSELSRDLRVMDCSLQYGVVHILRNQLRGGVPNDYASVILIQ